MTAHDVLPRTQSGRIFAPDGEEEAAECLRVARSRRTRLRLCGGDTRSRPRVDDPVDTLSSRRLCGVLRHDPRDRFIVARAGTPLQVVVDLLEQQGQRLPFEPPDHRQLLRRQGSPTIGAVAAANLTGPRGLDGGEARSHLLAARLLNGRAEAIRCGTATLKDVAGLDLTRLIAGSLGRLGLITEVAFRVEPIPERELTIRVATCAEALLRLSARARARGIRLTGAVWVDGASARNAGYDERSGAAFLRLDGPLAMVAVHRRRLLELLPAEADVEECSDLASAAIWARLRDGDFMPLVEDDDVWEWRLGDVADALDAPLPFNEPGLRWQFDLGARRLLCVVGAGQHSARLTRLASAVPPRCGLTLLRGSGSSIRAPRIPRPRSALETLEHAVLASFDPDHLLA